jgi:nitroreductase
MNTLDAVYNRRAVRDYLPQLLDKATINSLLDAAVHAPTAMHEEPWAFAVIQNHDMLNRLSETAKNMVRTASQADNTSFSKHALELVNAPGFNVFYNAGTLIVIYSKMTGPFVNADCWLAAENLMLTACSKQLGTCVIGFAVEALNSHEWKSELGVPDHMTAVAPIIVGFPAGATPPSPRKSPDIITWK